jgi:hypothetical protein
MALQKVKDSMRTTTALDATKLAGAVPTGSLGNAPATDLAQLEMNQALLAFKIAASNQLAKFQMVDQVIDEYQDATGIDAGASNNANAGGATTAKYYEGATGSNPTGGASVDTSVTGYRTHVFTGDASLTVTTPGNVDILVVAGGGSGGYDYGGGGGAGGLIYKTSHALTANTYDAVIGNGGAAKISAGIGNNGADSTWTINGGAVQFTAKGGGGGGLSTVTAGTGGSGGGGGHAHSGYLGGGAIQDGIYSTGNETSNITCTTNNISISSGTLQNWLDGNSSTNWVWGNGSTVAVDSYLRFQFSATQLVKEAQWYHGNTSDPLGVWQWQGSNDLAGSWTNIGAEITVSGLVASSPFVSTVLNANTTSYIYYQLLSKGTVGTNSNNTMDRMFFKRATTESHTYGFGYAGGDGTPAPSYDTGGGGGAGSVGADASGSGSGNGGTGKDMSAIFGTAVGESGWFASGGGGGLTSDGTAQEGTASNGGGTAGGNTSGNSAAGQANTGGGSGGGANGTYKSSGAGGTGVILVRYATDAFLGGGADLTLQSVATTAESAPTKADLVVLIEDGSGTATVNTDIKGYISRNGSAFSTAVTFVDEGDWGTNKRILVARQVDISGITSGTSMKYKLTTHNQSAGSKETRIQATSLAWS